MLSPVFSRPSEMMLSPFFPVPPSPRDDSSDVVDEAHASQAQPQDDLNEEMKGLWKKRKEEAVNEETRGLQHVASEEGKEEEDGEAFRTPMAGQYSFKNIQADGNKKRRADSTALATNGVHKRLRGDQEALASEPQGDQEALASEPQGDQEALASEPQRDLEEPASEPQAALLVDKEFDITNMIGVMSLVGSFWKNDLVWLVRHYKNTGLNQDMAIDKVAAIVQKYAGDEHAKAVALEEAARMGDEGPLLALLKAFPYKEMDKELSLISGIMEPSNNETTLIHLINSIKKISPGICLNALILLFNSGKNKKFPLLMDRFSAIVSHMSEEWRGEMLIKLSKLSKQNLEVAAWLFNQGSISPQYRHAALTAALLIWKNLLLVSSEDFMEMILNSGPILNDDEMNGVEEVDESAQWKNGLLLPDWVIENNWKGLPNFQERTVHCLEDLVRKENPNKICGASKNRHFATLFKLIREGSLFSSIRELVAQGYFLKGHFKRVSRELLDYPNLEMPKKQLLKVALAMMNERDRGKILKKFAGKFQNNLEVIQMIEESGFINTKSRSEALIAAAGAPVPKVEVVQYLCSKGIEEGGLLTDRFSKEEESLGENVNTSARSQAILAASKKGYLDVVDALLSHVELRDRDSHMLNALYDSYFDKKISLFRLLYQKAFWLQDEEIAKISNELKKLGPLSWNLYLGL